MLIDLAHMQSRGLDVGAAVARHGLFAARPMPQGEPMPDSSSSSSSSASSSASSSSSSSSESASASKPARTRRARKVKAKADRALAMHALRAAARVRAALDTSRHRSPESATAAKIAATLGITPDVAARCQARDRLESAIRSDDERALAVLATRGIDSDTAKSLRRSLGLSFRELADVPHAAADAEERAQHACRHGSGNNGAYGPADQKTHGRAYGGV
jgi:hypothetical protein